ncbi:MAG: glutamine--fructose-6-phosphate transaminase (isomerizing) [Alphaproteobacteria bacterium]|nr:glutamine--fructose-6-phosphate transaminase (isomerizing) [Alphaproteobacteria bacterium]
MCGIIGILGNGPVAPLLVDGLRRLEYRGYDSAGIATLVNGSIERRRAEGKLANLAGLIEREPVAGTIGLGHTRWATHGAPNTENAHPHATDKVAVVHNGIIENFQTLRRRMEAAGRVFETETDSEVVAHLITESLESGATPEDSVSATLEELEGAFALAVIFAGRHDVMFCARRGCPLAIGYGDGEMYVGSDALALAPLTQRISYLEEGDWAVVSSNGARIIDARGDEIERPINRTALSGALIGKGNFRHFMQKEIHEQPAAVGDTLSSFINPVSRAVTLPALSHNLADVSRVMIVACGTSYHSAMVAKYWIEMIARVPVEIDIASEFRYREAILPENSLCLFISQSGETADTLAALRHAHARDIATLAIVNMPESSMAREAGSVLATHAGPEIGVASTKAFTTQLATLACFTIALARAREAIDTLEAGRLSGALTEIPSRLVEILNHDETIAELAQDVVEALDILYLGRGTSYPIALEGALKLKEISYIHAEGFAAGEMKHGPIALIDETVPVIVIAPSDALFEKTASNVQEVIARGGRVVLLSDRQGIDRIGDGPAATIELPAVDPFVAPVLYTIPVQLLAYHVAVLRGTDVDQPRNLAKSVTVE